MGIYNIKGFIQRNKCGLRQFTLARREEKSFEIMGNKTSIIGVLPFRRVENPGVMFDSNHQEGACLLASCGEEIFCFILLLLFIGGILFSMKYITKDSKQNDKNKALKTFA